MSSTVEYKFDPVDTKNKIVAWIKEWFELNGPDCNAVIGISGGKDSSIVAALCVEALGKDRVIGCLLPNVCSSKMSIDDALVRRWNIADKKDGFNCDYADSYCETVSSITTGLRLCKHLGIKYYCRSIDGIIRAFIDFLPCDMTVQARTNLPARVRMCALYATAQSNNGRVANTSNLSESYLGYSSRWGDSVGDFAPIVNLTVSEVKSIGYACGLPKEFIERTPSDGLSGKSDEDNFGFKYSELDTYLRTGYINDPEKEKLILDRHNKNKFKLQPIASFNLGIPNPCLVHIVTKSDYTSFDS